MDIVAPKAKEIYRGEHGVPFMSDLSLADVNLDNYDAVIILGGKAPDSMRLNRGF
jgi:protease I